MSGYAKISKEQEKKISEYEKKTGTVVLAYNKTMPPATISSDEMDQLETLQKELGAVLVAYEMVAPVARGLDGCP